MSYGKNISFIETDHPILVINNNSNSNNTNKTN